MLPAADATSVLCATMTASAMLHPPLEGHRVSAQAKRVPSVVAGKVALQVVGRDNSYEHHQALLQFATWLQASLLSVGVLH